MNCTSPDGEHAFAIGTGRCIMCGLTVTALPDWFSPNKQKPVRRAALDAAIAGLRKIQDDLGDADA